MKIEQLDKTHILISLGENELADYALTFDSLSPEHPIAGRFLQELMAHASAVTGLSLHHKQVVMEAMQYEHGCLFLLTISNPPKESHKRKTYRIRHGRHDMVFRFDEAEHFLHCVQTLYHLGESHPHSAVYRWNGCYYLVLPSAMPLTRRCRCMAAEFSSGCRTGSLLAAFLREHGQVLQSDNAIQSIGRWLEPYTAQNCTVSQQDTAQS